MSNENTRIHLRAPVSLEVIVEGNSGKREARTSDISLGGCYIDAIHEVATGESVIINVHLPNDEWVSIKGVVVYAQWPTGFGVRFVDMSDDERKALFGAIKEHIVKQKDAQK